MNRLIVIILLALTPVAVYPQSGAEPFIEYFPTRGEEWLDSAYFSQWYQLPMSDVRNSCVPLSEKDYIEVAAELGVEVAAIKAVVDIETGRKHLGFWKQGKAIINFDLSIYRVYAPRHGVSLTRARKKYPVIFRSPDVRKYGSLQAAQYARLEAAMEIDSASALESCFWGMFQIGGFNWKQCGCQSIDEFCMLMNRSERDQLELFAAFCRANNLVRFIQKKDWASFALRYNGPGYRKLRYHKKMAEAYKKFSNASKH
ncbi:MAG: N-acetylmuramidase family protein [Muribaculaceae bacterium]|nr:N-acetylmuramidase family protein [Muribaculaceae bacterium]